MKKRLIVNVAASITSLLALWNCNSTNNDYTLSGRIIGIDTGWVYVKHRQISKVDSGRIEGGTFTISGTTETPEFCNIGTNTPRGRLYYFGFFLSAGKIKMTARKDSLFDAAVRIEGSPTQDEFVAFQKKMRFIDSLDLEIWMARQKGGNEDSLAVKERQLTRMKKDLISTYALLHPDSYVSALAVSAFLTQPEDVPMLDSIYNQMTPKLKKWFYGEKINSVLQKYKSSYQPPPMP